jgi:hypothetical protein
MISSSSNVLPLDSGSPEIAPDITVQTDTATQIPAFPAAVAVRGTHHIRKNDCENDACGGLHGGGDGDCAAT